MSVLGRKIVLSPWNKRLSDCLRSLSGTWTWVNQSPYQSHDTNKNSLPLRHPNCLMRFITTSTGEAENEGTKVPKEEERHRDAEKEPLPEWPDGVNPHTGEKGGPKGPEPTRYGDWERKGRVSDF